MATVPAEEGQRLRPVDQSARWFESQVSVAVRDQRRHQHARGRDGTRSGGVPLLTQRLRVVAARTSRVANFARPARLDRRSPRGWARLSQRGLTPIPTAQSPRPAFHDGFGLRLAMIDARRRCPSPRRPAPISRLRRRPWADFHAHGAPQVAGEIGENMPGHMKTGPRAGRSYASQAEPREARRPLETHNFIGNVPRLPVHKLCRDGLWGRACGKRRSREPNAAWEFSARGADRS